MKLLVIGGPDGMIAGAIAALADRDLDVRAVGRPAADLADPATLARAIDGFGPDAVICAGAYTRVDDAEAHADEAERINALGPGALARLCVDRDVPIVHISTDYVFDGAQHAPYVETDAPAPLGVYGRTKLAGEAGVLASGARCAILRTSWVHAPRGRNFVRTMLHLATTQPRIRVVDDQRGTPTYARHGAEAICLIARNLARSRDPALQGVFHMTAAGSCSWREFADAIFAGARLRNGPFADTDPINTTDYPTPARRPPHAVLDSARLRAAHGASLPDWRDGLDACLDEIAAGGWRVAPTDAQ